MKKESAIVIHIMGTQIHFNRDSACDEEKTVPGWLR